jgi:glycosyltransferase involved in cell wall biosynthesis
VVLLGWLDRDDLKDLLDSASALVLPSLEETFGNVLLEGMARRVEVIGGRASGAVPAVLGQGKYGILCDVTSPEALCAAMVQAEARAHVEAATAMLKEKYAAGALARRHLELYEHERVR